METSRNHRHAEYGISENAVEGVEATVDYLIPGSRINRRYVAPGAELNTGRYAPHTVFIRNGRPVQGALGLDTQGFMLAKQPSLVTNFRDKAEVDAVYSAEVERIVKALTGADLVVLLGCVLRTSGTASSESHSKAWRTPHTSFRDPRVQNAAPRESIEFRIIAYYL